MPHRLPRLLFLESLPGISGGQAVLLELVSALQGRCDMWALLPAEGPLAVALRARGVQCRLAPIGRYGLQRKSLFDAANYALRLPWLSLLVWRLIMIEHLDLVYANSSRTFVWGTLAAALASRPILWHQHSILSDGKSLALLNLIGRLTAVKKMIAVSPAAGANLPTLSHKTVVIPNGIDTARFHPDPAAGAAVRQELGLSAATAVIGIVGDLIPLKGQHTFLEAAANVVAQLPQSHFLIVGAPRPNAESQRYSANLKQRAVSLGHQVHFTDHRADLPAVYNALDVLVVASSTETVPLVLLEALASGVPVISTPVGRAPELLTDGKAGRLFPVGDSHALAQSLLVLLKAPANRASMSQHARYLAVDRFPLASFVQSLEAQITASIPGPHAHLR